MKLRAWKYCSKYNYNTHAVEPGYFYREEEAMCFGQRYRAVVVTTDEKGNWFVECPLLYPHDDGLTNKKVY